MYYSRTARDKLARQLRLKGAAAPPVRDLADWFLLVVYNAGHLHNTVDAYQVYLGMFYLLNLKRAGADLSYIQGDYDMWLLLWLARNHPTTADAVNMRDHFMMMYDKSQVCSDLRKAKIVEAESSLLNGVDLLSDAMRDGVLSQLDGEVRNWELRDARDEFNISVKEHMATGSYRDEKDLLEQTFPYYLAGSFY